MRPAAAGEAGGVVGQGWPLRSTQPNQLFLPFLVWEASLDNLPQVTARLLTPGSACSPAPPSTDAAAAPWGPHPQT